MFDVKQCRVCGCTNDDCSQCVERTGEPCYWVDVDLCSACAEERTLRWDTILLVVIVLMLLAGGWGYLQHKYELPWPWAAATYSEPSIIERSTP